MHCFDIDPDRAADALARLQVHVPHDVEIARIIAAKAADTEHEPGVAFMSEDGRVWWSHHGRAVRYVDAGHGLAELTEWGWRMERSRTVTAVD